MPKASKETASESVTVQGYEGHLEKLEGGYTVGHEKHGSRGLRPTRCRTAGT